jgi:Na+/melibiose symporter-like transporter
MNLRDRLLWYFFKINLRNPADRNAWYLVVELFWAAVLSSVATFNAAFAIRLGADNLQVGLLTSIPALIAVLVSIPAGQFLQRRARRTPWVFGSLLVHRAGYLLVALSPWLRLPGIEPGLLVVLILVINTLPAHFFNVGWIPLLADVVPEQRRAAVFAARNITSQATVSLMVFLCGQWLSRVDFPQNYQSLYLIGFLASMLSMYFLFKMQVPDSQPVEREIGARGKIRSLPELVRAAREALTGRPAFLRITVNTLLHGIGVWMAGPLYVLYFVRALDASDAWLGLNGTLASLGTIAGYSFWRWQMTRWGEPVTLKRTIVLAGLYAVLVGLTPSLPVILLYGVLNGLIAPGINLSHFNLLLKVTPPEARPRYTSIYMTIMNIGAFVCPLISVALADLIGLAPTLIGAGLLSMIGSTAFWWWPVPYKDPEPKLLPEG